MIDGLACFGRRLVLLKGGIVMELKAKIQRLLAAPDYRPLKRKELSRALGLSPHEGSALSHTLAAMLQHGPAASSLGAAGDFGPPNEHVARRTPLETQKGLT